MSKYLFFRNIKINEEQKGACLKRRCVYVAVWPFGQNYEPFYKPFDKYYYIIILIVLLIIANFQGNIV